MSLYRTLLALTGAAAAFAATPALAQHAPRDQDRAYSATQDGRAMPLPVIERKVMPFMGGADYLGPEFNGETYRMKFVKDGRAL